MKAWWFLGALAACQSSAGPSVDEPADEPGDDTDPSVDSPVEPVDPVGPTGELVDPTCVDGQYTEALPDVDADLSAARASFDPSDPSAFLSEALALRYPEGQFIFDSGRADRSLGDCVALFTTRQQRGSPEGMLEAASTLVHECGHFFDIGESGRRGQAFYLTSDVSFTCSNGSYATTPARSLITTDDYAPLRPACGGARAGCDFYADIYLDGDPTDRTFDSGDQGLDMLMEEAVQYVHSLATDMAFADRLRGSSVSARDGILTFLWYIERYLRYMRLETPRVYEGVLADACWRDLILNLWGQAWLFLEATDGQRALGIDDGELEDLVTDPDLLAEIQRVRDAAGCD